MEDEIRKHLSALRMIVAIAMLCAILSFAFSFILFKNVSIPLDQLQIKRINAMEDKLNQLGSAKNMGALAIEAQGAVLSLQKVANHSSGEVQAQARKAIVEIKALLDTLQGKKAAK